MGSDMAGKKLLRDTLVMSLRPQAKRYEVTDVNGGLFIDVLPSGKKVWRFRYRFGGAAAITKLMIGPFPAISYEDAKAKALEFQRELSEGRDPKFMRPDPKSVPTVEAVGDHYLAIQTDRYAKAVRSNLRTFLAKFGPVPANQLTGDMIAEWLLANRLTTQSAASHTVRHLSAAYTHAMTSLPRLEGMPEIPNPASRLWGRIKWPKNAPKPKDKRRRGGYRAAWTPEQWSAFYGALDVAYGPHTRPKGTRGCWAPPWQPGYFALELLAKTGARPEELLKARWLFIKASPVMVAGQPVRKIVLTEYKNADNGSVREIMLDPVAWEVIERLKAFHTANRIKSPFLFPVKRSSRGKLRKDAKNHHIADLSEYVRMMWKWGAPDFCARNLRSVYENAAIVALGDGFRSVIGDNLDHSAEVQERHYRQTTESQRVNVAARVGEALAAIQGKAPSDPKPPPIPLPVAANAA